MVKSKSKRMLKNAKASDSCDGDLGKCFQNEMLLLLCLVSNLDFVVVPCVISKLSQAANQNHFHLVF